MTSSRSRRPLRLVYPHQLFDGHLAAPPGTRFVLVEDDLLFRHQPVHAQKLVLHRASMRHFATRVREAGFEVDVVETDARRGTADRLAELVRRARPDRVEVVDVVDDWLARDCRAALAHGGYELRAEDVLESPNFLTTREQYRRWFAENPARMPSFYAWQRRRLDLLVEDGRPVGGRWSFDAENRRRLARRHGVPAWRGAPPTPEVSAAQDWVREEFPDAPGDAAEFAWPVTRDQALAALTQFVDERLAQFGPYEDAMSVQHPILYHAALTPALNVGLLGPDELVEAVMTAADRRDIPLPSLEGFLRQVIGWREYMRATYAVYGRRMRTANALRHTRSLAPAWWWGSTGLDPVDHVLEKVRRTGYAHHIERLMVLGNAMCLLRTHPDEVYEWFMAFFVDAYDWVMVPNVYAMGQYAVGPAITTKPYVSGSNYLRKMSDIPTGDWAADWDGLYWTFVADHTEVFGRNPRSRMAVRSLDAMDPERRSRLLAAGRATIDRL